MQSYLLMATVIFLPYVNKAASWCRGWFMGASGCCARHPGGPSCLHAPGPSGKEGSKVLRVHRGASSSSCHTTGPREPPASVEFFTFDLQEPLSKERVEAFSDGVYAIVATLLILDIW